MLCMLLMPNMHCTWTSRLLSDTCSVCGADAGIFCGVDGTELVAAVGNRVLVYQAQDGELLHNLKGHKVCAA